jgi:fido (protein-threonine AMPylation protein)
MSLPPHYGETPVPGDELQALLPSARDVLGEPVTKAAVYDLEQGLQVEVAEELMTAVLFGVAALADSGRLEVTDGLTLCGDIGVNDLVNDSFLRALHEGLYGEIWDWAGRYRSRGLNIGVAPEAIAVEVRSSLDSIRYRWEHTQDWTPRELGIAVHAETVRIHPFSDGNGRTTRLLADLVFAAAQEGEAIYEYDWDLDKREYIALLRAYDVSRDPRALAAFVEVRLLGS